MLTLAVLLGLAAGAAYLGGSRLWGWLKGAEEKVVEEAKKVEEEVKSKL
jgi:hypothetical protein